MHKKTPPVDQKKLRGILKKSAEKHQSGEIADAESGYRQILAVKPNHPDALHLLGLIEHQRGRCQEAVILIKKAIDNNPREASFYSNLGIIFQEIKQWDEAISNYRKAVAIKPDMVKAKCNLGIALIEKDQLDEAEFLFRQLLEGQPKYFKAYNNLGIILKKKNRFDEAIACYRKALDIFPDYAEAYNNLGEVFLCMEGLADAEAACRQAIALNPDYADAYVNLGSILAKAGKPPLAIKSFQKALNLEPDLADAYLNLGCTLAGIADFDEAMKSLDRSLALGHRDAWEAKLFTLNYHPDLSAERVSLEYQRWEETLAANLFSGPVAYTNSLNREKRLRIGYVSPDFRLHSTRHFIVPLLANHDHANFEIIVYAELKREDDWTARYRGWVDDWRPTLGLSDTDLAERIRADGIDILVDLAGHTTDTRMLAFVYRPAPVQISWLGYGYTTGLRAMDYFLGDERFTPVGCESLFSEHIWRLPKAAWCFRPPVEAPVVNDLPAQVNGYITFGCLSRPIRFNHRVIKAWANLLRTVPESRLMLNSFWLDDPATAESFIQRFVHYGIERERLIVTRTSVWEGYQRLDIALDPFPHNAGTTTFEALWMGLPVVSLRERPSVGRFGDAILGAMGLSEWVADSVDEYLNIASRLASDLDQLAIWRSELRGRMENSPLRDEIGFTRDVENAYREMWRLYCGKSVLGPTPSSTQQSSLSTTSEKLSKEDFASEGSNLIKLPKCTQKNSIIYNGVFLPMLEALKKAVELHQADQLAEAEAIYRQILAIQPYHSDALHLLGLIYHQRGHHQQASELLHQAIAKNSNNARYHFHLGIIFTSLNQLEQSIACYQKALRLQPGFVEVYMNLGIVLKDLGRLEEAEQVFCDLTVIQPNNFKAFNNRGVVLKELKRIDQAIQCYHNALRLNTDYAEAYNNLAVALQETGRLMEAEDCYHRALVINPDYAEAYSNLGVVLMNMGRNDEALTSFKKALLLNPKQVEILNKLGNIFRDMGFFKKAEENYQKALELNPSYADAYRNLASNLVLEGHFDEAIINYRKAITINPSMFEAYNDLGILFRNMDCLKESIKYYQQALCINQRYAEAYNNLGVSLKENHQLQEAIINYRHALSIKPDYMDAHRNLGSVLADLAQFNEGEQLIRQALVLKPDDADAHSSLLFLLNYHPDYSAEIIYQEYRIWEVIHAQSMQSNWTKTFSKSCAIGKRLRVGYVSPDFRAHSTRSFIAPILANHDHRRVEV
ncbi:tetratricopeptide repeat protein, partial [Candidatus Contendibacter odensensis]|uniref:tetratricopeptide repeat protein n=1 Tax=Candidatus Contendibacter odensensis TaxID=1400860 RepID=UPI000686813A